MHHPEPALHGACGRLVGTLKRTLTYILARKVLLLLLLLLMLCPDAGFVLFLDAITDGTST